MLERERARDFGDTGRCFPGRAGAAVPLAAELAGYLALEIAEGAAAAAAATGLGGDVDPRAVFIGEEAP